MRLLGFLLGPIIEAEELTIPRPPVFHRRRNQTIVYVKGDPKAVQHLKDYTDIRGKEVNCPLAKAWVTFSTDEDLLKRQLDDLSMNMQKSHHKHSTTMKRSQSSAMESTDETVTASDAM